MTFILTLTLAFLIAAWNEMTFILTLTVTFLIAAWSTHLHVSTKDSKQVVYEGGNATLPCSVLGNAFNPFLNPIIWYKLSHDEEAQYQVCCT